MNTFIRFFYEFISVLFDGVVIVFRGIVEGFKKMFNFSEYTKIISNYNDALTGFEKVLMWLSVLVVVIIFLLILLLVLFSMNFNIIRYKQTT